MASKIQILIQAQDSASPALAKVRQSIDSTTGSAERQSTFVGRLSERWGTFAAVSAGAGTALYGLFGQTRRATDSANRLQNALAGLNSIATAFKEDANAATRAAADLASDGLMTVAESATGLKNLLATGFSLPEAIELMNRFKDSAAFNRQASLGFGQAVASATEGIKNQNSILVDNAGVTKNLSVILKEAGYSATDLGNVTTDAGVRQALYTGILKETNAQLGDAAKLSDSAAGAQARQAAETEKLYQQIGLSLQPVLLLLLQTITPIVTGLTAWVSENQQLTSGLIIAGGVILVLITSLGLLATGLRVARDVAFVFGPVFRGSMVMAAASTKLLQAGLATTSARYAAMRLAMLAPIALPALAIGAALASIALVLHKWRETKAVIEETQKNIASADASREAGIKSLRDTARNGTPEQRKRAIDSLTRINSGRAVGGPVAAGREYPVGERGPELFVPSTSGTIIPAGGSGSAVNIYGNITIQTPEAADRFFDRLDRSGRLTSMGLAA